MQKYFFLIKNLSLKKKETQKQASSLLHSSSLMFVTNNQHSSTGILYHMFKLFSHSSMFPLHYVQLFVVSLHFLPSLWLCSPSSSWMRLPFLPGLSSRDRDDDVHFHICCTCNFQQSKDCMIWSNFSCLNCYDTYILHVSCIQIDEAF